jgi:hypothetical protein
MMIVYGSTANFTVSYDSSFTGGSAPDGPALSQAVLDYCEYDLARLSLLFGGILPPASSLPLQINLIPGSGGAFNNGVNTISCYCSVSTYIPGLPALVVAEEAEIFMNLQAKGWIAGYSNGEALSRVSAQILYPNNAWLWSTGNSWLNGDPSSPNPARSDWVDNVWHTDQDYVSIGCGSLFLNYLAYQLNYRWTDIIAAGAATTNTLAETATILGVSNAWVNFSTLMSTYLPSPSTLPPQPTQFGQPPEPTDDQFPLGPVTAPVPALYMRHNLADDGTSHTGSLSDSPDIILKNNPVANPQATYSTAASIASDAESDPDVLPGQDNYVYLRLWNRSVAASNVFATVYWSPPATLVTPNLWTLIGSAYYPDVPAGSMVEVSTPGITWPADQLPGVGHDCFVAAVGNADAPGPNPASFATFADFENYIYANNNITWRNFNVGIIGLGLVGWGEFFPLPFLITGAWNEVIEFTLETHADLPEGSRLALQVPHSIGRGLQPAHPTVEEFEDKETDPDEYRRLRIPLAPNGPHALGGIQLPAGTAARSHLLVHIPRDRHAKPHRVVIKQLHNQREVGRITWLLLPDRDRR